MSDAGEALMLAADAALGIAKALAEPLPQIDRARARKQFGDLQRDFRQWVAGEIADAELLAGDLPKALEPPRGASPETVAALADASAQVDRIIAKRHRIIRARMNPVIRQTYTRAFELGLRAGGASRPMQANEEKLAGRMRANEYAYLDNFLVDVRNREGQMPYPQRASMYANAVEEAYWAGYVYADLSQDRLMAWRMNGKAENCFPAGTLVATPAGDVSIEMLRVGDMVNTMTGPRRVTKLWERTTQHSLVTVRSGQREVQCTPNHPFLTRRGWIEARHLRDGEQVVLAQDRVQQLRAEVALPDADHRVPAFAQVGGLALISGLLQLLAGVRGPQPWMPVPVVAVDLKQQRPHSHVDDVLGVDHERWLKRYAQRSQSALKLLFKAVWGSGFQALATSHKPLQYFGMLRIPGGDLGSRRGTMHRVVGEHVLTPTVVDQAAARFGGQYELHSVGLVAHARHGIAQGVRNGLGTISGIVRHKVGNLFRCPEPLVAAVSGTLAACSGGLGGIASAHGTYLEDGMRPSQEAVTAEDTTKGALAAARAGARKGRLTFAALELSHSSSPHQVCTSEGSEVKVFNLEVEGVHHYIANGFVVHNCDDCAYMAGDRGYLLAHDLDPDALKATMGFACGGRWGTGIYTALELAQLAVFPQSGALRCTTNCRCKLVQAQRPANKPKGAAAHEPFHSLEPKAFHGEREHELPRRGRAARRAAKTGNRFHPRRGRR